MAHPTVPQSTEVPNSGRRERPNPDMGQKAHIKKARANIIDTNTTMTIAGVDVANVEDVRFTTNATA